MLHGNTISQLSLILLLFACFMCWGLELNIAHPKMKMYHLLIQAVANLKFLYSSMNSESIDNFLWWNVQSV